MCAYTHTCVCTHGHCPTQALPSVHGCCLASLETAEMQTEAGMTASHPFMLPSFICILPASDPIPASSTCTRSMHLTQQVCGFSPVPLHASVCP